MPSPSASTFAFAELAPHSLQLAIISGRRLVALRSFALDAKADIAAFVSEHGVAGSLRASFLAGKGGLHRSAEGEAAAVRRPAALLAHAGKLNPSFDSPVAVAVDAATGAQPDAARVAPWVIAAVDGEAHAEARALLGELGLAPAEFTLAAPIQLGAVVASLSAGETALVVMPGDTEAGLAWVGEQGVVDVSTAPLGYAAIYDAVQQGLGLKFKAAAGKLFYNENYDFTDTAPKIAASLADVLRPALEGKPAAGLLHIAGLTSGQPWLVEALAKALGLGVWTPSADKLAAGLDAGDVSVGSFAAGVLRLAAQGSGDAPWIQSPLDVIAQRSGSRPAQPAVVAAAPAPAVVAPAPVEPKGEPKPAAPARAQETKVVAKPVPAKAAPSPASEPERVQSSEPAPASVAVVESVAVTEAASEEAAPVAAKKSSKGPILIASAVGVVAAVVGLAMHFRSPAPRPEAKAEPAAPVEQAAPAAPAQPASTPVPAGSPKAPTIAAVPAPAPIMIPAASAAAGAKDQFAGDARRFGNERYRFEVSEKGVIQAFATARDEVLIESAAGISLQGSYVGTEGRRRWFNVGGVDDAGYQAVVRKNVRDGVTVFDVKVTHPRFELTQTFHCLPDSLKVTVKFNPINLRDPRGVIAAVHSVRLSPLALNSSLRMRATTNSFAYAMKMGTLRVGFDATNWGRDAADGRQLIVAGENAVAFHFTDSADAAHNTLAYEISVP